MGAMAWKIHREACLRAASAVELAAADAALDAAATGGCLTAAADSALLAAGAHEPTPTPYFILDELLGGLGLGEGDRLLDVGCGSGRVLAYAAAVGLPCRVTGVELDARLASFATDWARRYEHLEVVCGSALDLPLGAYTHFYLFNPFDNDILLRFLDRLEGQAERSVVLVHMSDNGEGYSYLGRAGWALEREGEFYEHRDAGGSSFPVFGCPQHYSIWRFEPSFRVV